MTLLLLAIAAVAGSVGRAAAGPAPPGPGNVPAAAAEEALPAERPLQAVIDVAQGRVVVNRATGVRIDGLRAAGELRFTLVNLTSRRQPVRIGLLHLPEGEYDVYAAGPKGSGTKLDDDHLAAGWQFVLPPPQAGTPFGKAVGRLTDRVKRLRLLLSSRAEPELTKALTPLEAALSQSRKALQATRRTDVAVVRAGTTFIQAPVKSTMLSDEEMVRRWSELDRLQRELVAAADRSGDAALAARVRGWFNIRIARPTKGARLADA